jgi:hypothetical protein
MADDLKTFTAVFDGSTAFEAWLAFVERERQSGTAEEAAVCDELLRFARRDLTLAREIFVHGYASAVTDAARPKRRRR